MSPVTADSGRGIVIDTERNNSFHPPSGRGEPKRGEGLPANSPTYLRNCSNRPPGRRVKSLV